MMGEQNRIQLEALRRQFREAGMGFELQPVSLPATRRKGGGDDADAKARELQVSLTPTLTPTLTLTLTPTLTLP